MTKKENESDEIELNNASLTRLVKKYESLAVPLVYISGYTLASGCVRDESSLRWSRL